MPGDEYYLKPNVVLELAQSDLPNDFFYGWILGNRPWAQNELYAKIIVARGDSKLSQTDINTLFQWIQGLNWPGAIEIFDFLKTIFHKKIIAAIPIAYEQAVNERDPDFMCNLAEIITEAGITKSEFNNDFLWNELKKIVDQYGNPGGYDIEME